MRMANGICSWSVCYQPAPILPNVGIDEKPIRLIILRIIEGGVAGDRFARSALPGNIASPSSRHGGLAMRRTPLYGYSGRFLPCKYLSCIPVRCCADQSPSPRVGKKGGRMG